MCIMFSYYLIMEIKGINYTTHISGLSEQQSEQQTPTIQSNSIFIKKYIY